MMQYANAPSITPFATGGIVKPSVEGGSTKARAVANKAIGKVHGRALEKYRNRKERLAAMAAASGNFNYTGPPADFSQLGSVAARTTQLLI
jgi:hypothetical protein